MQACQGRSTRRISKLFTTAVLVSDRISALSQELLTLLTHLDKDKVGYVGLDEFVRGLQFIRNAAVVTSTPPPNKAASLRRAHSEIIVCAFVLSISCFLL